MYLPEITPPAPAQVEKLLSLLQRKLGPSKYLTARESCETYSRDNSEADGRLPDAVVLAESNADILTTLEIAREAGVPVTPRAAGTGRAGGATVVAGGIVLSMVGMSGVRAIDRSEQMAVVGPGTILADLHREVEEAGLFYPPDANSLDACTIGGNVATNAGGPRAFKYGSTRDYVLGVETFFDRRSTLFLR